MKGKFSKCTPQTLKTQYDPEADVLSWDVAPRAKISYATEMGNIVVHFTKKQTPVLIEVLEASKVFSKSERMIERMRSGKNI